MKKVHFFSLLALLILITSACNGPKLLTENIHYKKGDTYTYRQNSDITSTVSVMGKNVVNEQKQGYLFENKITEIKPNGDVNMVSTLKAINYEMETMGNKIKYNSEDKSQNEQAESIEGIYANMIGQQFNLLLDSKGQLKEFSGSTEMFQKIEEQMKKDDLPTEGLEVMKGQFGDDAMTQMYGNSMTSLLPTTPVKIGDSWNKSMDMKILGLKLDMKYTLTKIANGKAFLKIDGIATPTPDSEPMKMMGMEMKYNLSGTQSGTAIVDLKTGFPTTSTVKQDFSGTMTMSGGMLPGEMDADMTIKGTTTYVQE